jgi:hypothetical protein
VGTAVGSPGFLAPEQVRGQTVTPATDVFSLGATLAYAALGDSPFGQGSSEVMLYRVVHEEPELHGVPAALAPLLRSCLAKSPQERPTTLQLSLRLKEIAAREARGVGGHATGARQRPAATAGTGSAGNAKAAGRAPARAAAPAGARPRPGPARRGPGRRPGRGVDGRLLRQRLIIFVTVTLLVALGIAAAQGCQGPV